MNAHLSRSTQQMIFFIILFVVGAFILFPKLNFQSIILQGDHGRDLYVFQQTALGSKPYQDYWWVYGPLMPYYYAVSFKVFGFNIASILIGEIFLIFLTTFVVYLTLLLLVTPAMSFLGALWFLSFHENFFHTYNHAGTILFIYLSFYFLLSYLKEYKHRSLYYCLIALVLATLTKLNMGISAYGAVILVLGIASRFDQRISFSRQLYLHYFLTFPLIIILGYSYFIVGIPISDLKQYFPFTPSSQSSHTAIHSSIILWVKTLAKNFVSSLMNFIFGILILGSLAHLILLIRNGSFQPLVKRFILSFFLAVGIFYVLLMHEFWLTSDAYKSFWARLLSMYLIFVCLDAGMIYWNNWVKRLLWAVLMIIACMQIIHSHQMIQQGKIPERFLSLKHGKVYINNPPGWMNTVAETTHQINALLKNDETFLALPYDPLYYYLTDRISPTRQLIFFEYLKLSRETIDQVIQDLENKNVQYVVISNRLTKELPQDGQFQQVYCPRMNAYLNEHFIIHSVIGNWKQKAGFFENHATMILKRK